MNYEALKNSISSTIKTNGEQRITGAVLQEVLLNMVSSLGQFASYAGIANPGTNPAGVDGNVFYIATATGNYQYFGFTISTSGYYIISNLSGVWNLVRLPIAADSATYAGGISVSGYNSVEIRARKIAGDSDDIELYSSDEDFLVYVYGAEIAQRALSASDAYNLGGIAASLYLTKSDAAATYQPLITATNKLPYNLLSGTPTIPTNTNQLTNGAGYINAAYVSQYLADNNYAKKSDITAQAVGLGNVQNTAFYTRSVDVNGEDWEFASRFAGQAFSIYAPTSAGTTGQVLVSTGGTPSWASSVAQAQKIKVDTTSDTEVFPVTDYEKITAVSVYGDETPLGERVVMLNIGDTNPFGAQIAVVTDGFHDIGYRKKGDTAWKLVAFTDSNVASADNAANLGGIAATMYLTKSIAATTYQPLITATNKLPYSLLSGTPTIPTNTNQLTNGAGYITNAALAGYALKSELSSYLSKSGGTITGTLKFEGTAEHAININDQLYIDMSNGDIVPNSGNTVSIGANGKNFANGYFDSLYGHLYGAADKATKLATPRTIWGQSFDGSGNVTGNLTGSNFFLMDRSSNPYLQLTDTGGTVYFQAINGIAYIGSTYTKSLAVDASGNVGIGTVSPTEKLMVGGNIAPSASLTYNLGTSALAFSRVYGRYFDTASGYDMRLCTGGTQRVHIVAASGNVMIGTESDNGYKLRVAGNIFASGLTLQAAANNNTLITINGNANTDNYLMVYGSQYAIGLGIGSGNVSRGLYDITNGHWWISRRESNSDTYIQGTVNAAKFVGNIEASSGSISGNLTASTINNGTPITSRNIAGYLPYLLPIATYRITNYSSSLQKLYIETIDYQNEDYLASLPAGAIVLITNPTGIYLSQIDRVEDSSADVINVAGSGVYPGSDSPSTILIGVVDYDSNDELVLHLGYTNY